MYIRKSKHKTDRRTYTNHLLVESVSTPEGPRQKTVCSLGSLSPGPRKKWHALARRLLAALEKEAGGGMGMAVGGVETDPGPPADTPETPVIDPKQIRAEKALEAGPVLAGHAVWVRLQLGNALAKAGLPPKAAKLAQMICLNLLAAPKPGAPLVPWARQTTLPRIQGEEPGALASPAQYQQLDRLPARRAAVEKALAVVEKRLFGLDDRGLVFDLRTITFAPTGGNGPAARGGAASRGPKVGALHSTKEDTEPNQAESTPAAGLILDRRGFVRAHEPFGSSGKDRPALAAVLRRLGRRSGMTKGGVVVLHPAEAAPANLALVRKLGHRCLVVGGKGDLGDAAARRVTQLLATHDERMAQLTGQLAGTPLLEQLPLTPEARLFLLLIAGHLLTTTELLLDNGGIKRPWSAIREVLRCHQLVVLALPLSSGKTIRIEREAGPDAEQKAVYGVLGVALSGTN